MNDKEVRLLRKAIKNISQVQAQENLSQPHLSSIVVPEAHWQALELDTTVVVGDRGMGKSFWTAVLSNKDSRDFVADLIESKKLLNTFVCIGFSAEQDPKLHPNKSLLKSFLSKGVSQEALWKAIIIKCISKALEDSLPVEDYTWHTLTQWVEENDEIVWSKITEFDERLKKEGKTALIVFDALDRLADNWNDSRAWTSSALKVALELRSNRAIRTKFFLRTDMADDDKLWQFQDSSKLQHSKVVLRWSPMDLFDILIRYLSNYKEKTGRLFRDKFEEMRILKFVEQKGVYIARSILHTQDEGIRKAVEKIAGEFMGKSPKRGRCYSWIPVHLADAKGGVSPRSLLLALQVAARETDENFPEHSLPLHYEAIKDGVAKASGIRVEELKEDYPWVEQLLKAMEGQTVPIDKPSLEILLKTPLKKISYDKLPPRRYSDPLTKGQFEALLNDMEELGILYRTKDNRINIPDIYRVGYRIGRKGGVKPIKS